MHFTIKEGSAGNQKGGWRWRLEGENGKTVASGEGYTSKSNCIRAIRRMKEDVATAEIVNEDGSPVPEGLRADEVLRAIGKDVET